MGYSFRANKHSRISLLTILIIMVVMPHFSFANQTKIDSLNKILTKPNNDSIIYHVYTNLGLQWESIDFDSAMVFYNNCIDIADKNSWNAKEAQALINIAYAHIYVRHSKDAEAFLLEGLELYIKAKDSMGIMNTYYNLGYFYGIFENFPKSTENFRKAEAYALNLNHNKRLVDIYNNLGLMYNYTGLYDKANTYNFKSLKLSEKIGDKSIGNTHLNIGLNYFKEGNLEKSLEHHSKALNIFRESGEKPYIALSLKNIGDDYFGKNQDSALKYYNKAYVIYQELNDVESIARHFLVIGNINFAQKNFVDANKNYRKAIDMFPEKGSRRLLFSIYANIVKLNLYITGYTTINRHQLLNETLNYAQKMNQIALELGSYSMEVDSYEKLYKTYSKIGNTTLALKYADKYIISKDSLFSEQKQKTISELHTKYETEKKELEIQTLNSDKELISLKLIQNDLRHKKQMIMIYVLVGGFLLVAIFLSVIYKFYQKTKEANTKLSKQKEEKEVLLKEIHHRVKNNLQIVSSLLNLQTKNIKDESFLSVITDGQNRIKAMALIHQRLYQNKNISTINIKEYTSQLLNQIAGLYPELSEVKREIISNDIELDIDTAIPIGLILNELITNAYKYAFTNKTGIITISIKQNAHDYILEVHDNGVGLPADFNISTTNSIGLRLVSRLSRQLYGKSTYKYADGCKFMITFKDTISRKETE